MLHRGALTISHAIALTVRSIVYVVVWPFRAIARGIFLIVRGIAVGTAWIIRTIAHAIAQTIRAMVHGIAWIIRTIAHAIAQTIRAIVHGIAWIIRTIAHAIAQTIRAIVHGIAATFNAIGNGIAWIIRTIAHTIAQTIRAIARGIVAAVYWILSPVRFVALRLRPLTVTLSVEEGAMRVVVFQGRQVVNWDHVTLENEPADPEQQAPASPAATDRLRRALAELGAQRGRLVTDLPPYTPLMRHFQLPKSGGRYLENMVVSEVLDTIPFEVDEVDITWRSQRNRTGQEVIAVAVPKDKIDGRVRLAREAGLPPRAAYSRAAALAFAAGFPDSIVINVQRSETAVILVRDGSPRVLHQLETTSGAVDPQQQADALATAVQRVIGYYQPIYPETDSTPLPVVMTGQAAADDSLAEILSQSLGRAVLPFAPALNCPDDFPQSEYAANLGLFLADQTKGKPRSQSSAWMAPALNLLPERHLPQGLPVQAFLSFAIIVLLGAAIFPATSQIDAMAREADQLSIELERVQSEERKQRKGFSRERTRQILLQEDQGRALGMEARLAELKLEMNTLVDQLRAITEVTLPFSVELANVAPKEEGISLTGVADSYGDVFQYAENLRASPQFEDASVLQVTRSGPGNVSFTMLAIISQSMEEEEEKKP